MKIIKHTHIHTHSNIHTHTPKKPNVFLHACRNEHRMVRCVFMAEEKKNLLHFKIKVKKKILTNQAESVSSSFTILIILVQT